MVHDERIARNAIQRIQAYNGRPQFIQSGLKLDLPHEPNYIGPLTKPSGQRRISG